MLVLVWLLATVIPAGAQPGLADRAAGWDPAAAARYLDDRLDLWWAKAKVLRTGPGEARCLSCHTALPYAMARPALRAALGVGEPTPHERRILETVRLRVEHAATQQAYYDHTEAKALESRGVEAVLNALLLGLADTAGTGPQDPAARMAMARLWETQRTDGAWDWLDFGLEPYESAGAVFHGAALAAIAAGTPAGAVSTREGAPSGGLDRLRGFLQSRVASESLFNRTWALLASARLPGLLTLAQRDTIVRDLASRQRPDGGWSLADLGTWRWSHAEPPYAPPGETDSAVLSAPDGYATGLVVYALRQAGVGQTIATAGQAWLRANQVVVRPDTDGGAPWRAHSLNFDREHGGAKGEPWRRLFMSDLATAFAALALL